MWIVHLSLAWLILFQVEELNDYSPLGFNLWFFLIVANLVTGVVEFLFVLFSFFV